LQQRTAESGTQLTHRRRTDAGLIDLDDRHRVLLARTSAPGAIVGRRAFLRRSALRSSGRTPLADPETG
jgi:hypothetical protein